MAELTELEKRIRVLEDIEAIKNLKGKYLRCLDLNLWNEMEECFVEDAVADYGENMHFEGRNAILEFLKGSLGQDIFITSHECHTPEIEIVSDTEARGIWKLHDYVVIQPNSTMTGWAHYNEEYVKEKGLWKIKYASYTRSFEEWVMKKPS